MSMVGTNITIKKYYLPQDQTVILTKVFYVVGRSLGNKLHRGDRSPEEYGYVNQSGLSRKVRRSVLTYTKLLMKRL